MDVGVPVGVLVGFAVVALPLRVFAAEGLVVVFLRLLGFLVLALGVLLVLSVEVWKMFDGPVNKLENMK